MTYKKAMILRVFVLFFMFSVSTIFVLSQASAEPNINDIKRIAEEGNLDAQTEVPASIPGDNYDGVVLSVNQIIKKAEQGDIYAQYNLALMYADGKGVSQDIDQSASWLLEAANHGHFEAQRYLASLYETGGWGFPRDNDKAEYWKNLRGRLPSSTTGNTRQEDDSKKGTSYSGFALFSAFIIFGLIGLAFIVNKKKIKTTKQTETIALDFLESNSNQIETIDPESPQSESSSESDITFDDL
jgi:hypothetical protein